MAIEQRIGNTGLLLHAIGERNVGRIDVTHVENEIGLECDYRFQIGGVAASGEAADLRPGADVGQQELPLLGAVGAWPAEQQLGGERIEQNRRRRPGREHAGDVGGDRDRSAGRVCQRCGARCTRRCERGQDT